jgi:hypothetical protein
MKRLPVFILILLLIGLGSCKKDEISTSDQFPAWLQAKITELVPEQNLCEITEVTIIEYNGAKYYHIYCEIWSCMYCQLFDGNGNRPNWDENGWNNFFAKQKAIKTVPACP